MLNLLRFSLNNISFSPAHNEMFENSVLRLNLIAICKEILKKSIVEISINVFIGATGDKFDNVQRELFIHCSFLHLQETNWLIPVNTSDDYAKDGGPGEV